MPKNLRDTHNYKDDVLKHIYIGYNFFNNTEPLENELKCI